VPRCAALLLLHGLFFFLACLSFQSAVIWAEQQVVAALTITSPPSAQASSPPHLLRRDSSTVFSYGSCVGTYIPRPGAFCCNPGTSFSPNCEFCLDLKPSISSDSKARDLW
jgi:hypothetical protein